MPSFIPIVVLYPEKSRVTLLPQWVITKSKHVGGKCVLRGMFDSKDEA